MKETEQDLREEYSKSAQKKNQNNRNILEEQTDYLSGKRVVNKWKLREPTIIETSEDDEELMTLEESRQKTTQGVNRKTREKLHINKSSKYKKMRKKNENIKRILESIMTIVEEEDNNKSSDAETDDEFWDYRVPNRF